jgi:ribose transport system permease protein
LKSSTRILNDLINRFGLLLVWVAVIILFSILRPKEFPTASNFQTILSSQAVLLIMALALLLPLAAGEFDLSVAGVLSLSLVLIGYLNVVQRWPIGLAIATAILCGLAVGFINVLFIISVGVDSIVVTLGMGTLLVGVGYGIRTTTSVGIARSLVASVQHQVFGLQLSVYYAVGLTFAMWYVFSYTPLGRYLYFVGAARNAARLAGIPVDKIRVGALLAASLISALDGAVLAGSLEAAAPNVGATYLLPAFAAVFLGATTVTPGRFNPWGTFVATYFLITGITGLELMGLVGWIELVFYGGVLVIAVAISRVASKSLEKKSEQVRADGNENLLKEDLQQ